jgi:hypothetical protein
LVAVAEKQVVVLPIFYPLGVIYPVMTPYDEKWQARRNKLIQRSHGFIGLEYGKPQ